MQGEALFIVDVEHRRLWPVSLTTGGAASRPRTWAVGPPGVERRPGPALFAHGVPGVAPRFSGPAAAPDGSLLLSSNGEGTMPRPAPSP
ncbi:hypothetical protein RFN58_22665 [Streptomyces iakyrus]|uniref:hypothetical protein n=1 Tax=Streptomyces iakyrus TaxID=68219 RepID=UPI0005253D0E|nr:hypothetical protein [Streptomyces iakyrus]